MLALELTEEHVLEAIRRGRTFVSFDFLGDAAGFAVTYGRGEDGGAPSAILGEEAPYRAEALLEVELPLDGVIRVLRDGAPWREEQGRSFAAPVPGPGTYRVEADRVDCLGRARLWINSAPNHVTEPKE